MSQSREQTSNMCLLLVGQVLAHTETMAVVDSHTITYMYAQTGKEAGLLTK